MQNHYREAKSGKDQEEFEREGMEPETEEQKAMQRLSDDEDEDLMAQEINFKDFLVINQSKTEQRPEVFKFDGSSVNWQEKYTLKNQTIFDNTVLCEA